MTLEEFKKQLSPNSYWKIEYIGDKKCRLHRPVYFLWAARASATQNPLHPKAFAMNNVQAVIFDPSRNSWNCYTMANITFHPIFDKLSPATLDQFQVFWHLGDPKPDW